MPNSSTHFQIPRAIRDLIRSQKCVAFVGSGPSSRAYHPWPQLVNALCERCGISHRVSAASPGDELLDAAQLAKDADRAEYFAYLGQHFGRFVEDPPRLYGALFRLPFDSYLTVNLDPLLALESARSLPNTPLVKVYPSLDRKSMGRQDRSIHYLHGYIQQGTVPEDGTVVLSRQEFENAYKPDSAIRRLLLSTLAEDPVLFIGCRLHEPVMKGVFDICKQQQQERLRLVRKQGGTSAPPPRYILLPEITVTTDDGMPDNSHVKEEETTKENAYYEEMEIIPVRYPTPGGQHFLLGAALEDLAELPQVVADYGWEEF